MSLSLSLSLYIGNNNAYTNTRLQGYVGDGNCYAMGGMYICVFMYSMYRVCIVCMCICVCMYSISRCLNILLVV